MTLKEELLKEFERGNGGRGIALWINHKCKKNGEPAQTNVFKIEELVKLAYSGFNDGSRETITNDCFVKGLHEEMQLAVRGHNRFCNGITS